MRRERSRRALLLWKGAKVMSTGKKPASDAGRQLAKPNTSKPARRVAASDLAQRKPPPKKK
jgi:hypothetical protein